MNCTRCGKDNPSDNKYCGQCGTALTAQAGITIKDLMDKGILVRGSRLFCRAGGYQAKATVTADAKMEYQGNLYDSPLTALEAVRGIPCDGWYDWQHGSPDEGRIAPLWVLRHMLLVHQGVDVEFPHWWLKYVQVPELHLATFTKKPT